MDGDPGERETGGSASEPSAEQLRAYVAANHGRFTDAAITAELRKAGHAEGDIRAALAEAARTATAEPSGSHAGKAFGVILGAYAVVFAVLSLGMIANAQRLGGTYAPNAVGGIAILAGSMGVALTISLFWVGFRRLGALIVAAMLGFYGLAMLAGDLSGVVPLGLAAVLVLLVLRGRGSSTRSTATLGALLSLPMILLVILTGLCIATGMPIPGSL